MRRSRATLCVVTAGVLWGIISIFVNALSSFGYSGVEISFTRTVVCALLLGIFLLVYDHKLLQIKLRHLWMFIGTGIVSLTLFSYCYFTTIINVEASVAVALLYTSPVFVMLFSALLFKEKITALKGIAGVMTVAGCALISGFIGSGGSMTVKSLIIGISAGLFYALYSVFCRYALKHYHPLTINFYTFLFASFGFMFIVKPSQYAGMFSHGAKAVAIVLVSGIVCGILPYLFYTVGLSHLETSVAGVLVAVEPLVGSVVGIVGFGESVAPLKLTGIALILASIIMLSVEPKKNGAKRRL